MDMIESLSIFPGNVLVSDGTVLLASLITSFCAISNDDSRRTRKRTCFGNPTLSTSLRRGVPCNLLLRPPQNCDVT